MKRTRKSPVLWGIMVTAVAVAVAFCAAAWGFSLPTAIVAALLAFELWFFQFDYTESSSVNAAWWVGAGVLLALISAGLYRPDLLRTPAFLYVLTTVGAVAILWWYLGPRLEALRSRESAADGGLRPPSPESASKVQDDPLNIRKG